MLPDASLQVQLHAGQETPLEPGHATPWRSLPFGLFAQHVGTTPRLLLEVEEGPPLEIGGGDGLLLAPFAVHRIGKLDDGPSSSRWLHFSLRWRGSIELLRLWRAPTLVPRPVADVLGACCADLGVVGRVENPWLQESRRQALLYAFASSLIAWIDPPSPRDMPGLQRLMPVLDLLHEAPERPFRLGDLAAMVDLAPSRFSELFRQGTGRPPMAYLQDLRMQRACRLLRAGDQGMAAIAASCGYDDALHFSRQFRRRLGESPSSYRRRARSSDRGF